MNSYESETPSSSDLQLECVKETSNKQFESPAGNDVQSDQFSYSSNLLVDEGKAFYHQPYQNPEEGPLNEQYDEQCEQEHTSLKSEDEMGCIHEVCLEIRPE